MQKFSLPIFIFLIIIGFIVVKVTGDNRAEAERKLEVEMRVQGAANQAILIGIKMSNDFEQQRKQAAFDRVTKEYPGY